MSQEDVEFLRRVAVVGRKVHGRADLEALAALFHPDVEARDLQHAPDTPEVLRGRAAVLAMWEQWMEALGEWTYELSEFIDADPWVVCAARWHATGKGSDLPVDWQVADAYQVEDGQIVRAIFGFPDVATALEAIGAERGGGATLSEVLKPDRSSGS
jgi:ketosteroid isomerase-like protein